MTIKELETSLGMTRANIRFYEQEGFLTPERGANNYRIYSEEDVETLRKIKLLRQLGLPLDTIKQVQSGELGLDTALARQQHTLEEQRAAGEEVSPEVIQSLKLGLMGPLAGIGDSVDQGIVATIPLAIFVPMALNGSVWAAFMPGLIYLAWSYGWSWFLFQKGYSLGRKAVLEILHSGMIKKVIDIASIVGLFMIGCLSASYVKVTTALTYVNNDTTVALQDTLNGIIPNLLPFCVVMGMYLYITKRGPKYLRLMVYTMVIAIVLTFFGII